MIREVKDWPQPPAGKGVVSYIVMGDGDGDAPDMSVTSTCTAPSRSVRAAFSESSVIEVVAGSAMVCG